MDANGKKATSEELLTRAWNAIEESRDYAEEVARDAQALARFQREAQAASAR